MKAIKSTLTLARRLRNAEHFNFYELILKYCGGKTLKPAALQPVWTAFRSAFDREDVIYKRFLGQENTRLINEAHKRRRNSCMGLKRTIEVAAYSNTPALEAAADELTRILDNYPHILQAPMTEVAAMTVNLVQDLLRPAHASAVRLAGAAEAISRLSADNDTFMTLYNERTHSEGEEKEEGSLQEARKQTDSEFATLASVITAFYQANEKQRPKDPEVSEALSDLILFLNSHIAQYEAIYARRTPGGYHPGKGGRPDEPGGPDDDFETPDAPDDVPQLVISAQEILGSHEVMSNMGTQMSLRAGDAQAFAAALYPAAEGGALRLTALDTESPEEPQEYPVAGFLFASDGTTPEGLVVDAPDAATAFSKPFDGTSEAGGEVFKDGGLLATLRGLQFPGYMKLEG
ncbi:MAG: DUF6261 family protein [Tannerellaceae bacterium]|jgi:hypothetical protein|nr:DUF6261 family protein [Tannerellaceae bacterium]